MEIAVIISTYNSPDWLEKVLWGYSVQTLRNFTIIIADDGSGGETRQRIEGMRRQLPVSLVHQWHEAPDYQRQKILNQCIRSTGADYLVFTDGDCIPRNDFLEVHASFAQRGFFLSGGYCKLPMELSKRISPEDICSRRVFSRRYLFANGLRGPSQWMKLLPAGPVPALLDFLTPTRPTWNNCNSSAFREDIVGVNGFDERMKYGGSDRELGERLWNRGLKSRQIRHRAICLHLDHSRGYATPESIERNMEIRRRTVAEKRTWTRHGIIQGLPQS
ncbi:MAG: glycosyltransferase [Oceanipulchritudo sp.]